MIDFGVMFFPSRPHGELDGGDDKYHLLMEAAKFADAHGFSAVWTPERHFHEFGGIFPNPSVVSAALAVATRRIQIRAGSLISPLHDPIRIVEDWSVVDNLSRGRVGISFGSGWNVDDFVFFPERYQTRQAVMFEQIKTVRKLWKGAALTRKNSLGKDVEVKIYPRPVQKHLPVWVTSSGNVETFVSAGKIGAHILTHLIGQDVETLREKISRYRASLRQSGFAPDYGKVTLMLHTFLGPDVDAARAKVKQPFREYLRSAVQLESRAAQSGGAISGGHVIPSQEIPPDVLEELLEITYERYVNSSALIGTPESCLPVIGRLEEVGVNEVACLIDFGAEADDVLPSLTYLNQLREAVARR